MMRQAVVAVVDDDASFLDVMHQALADEGYCCAFWPTGEPPTMFVERAQPDLVILDIQLGDGISYWTVIEALCADAPTVRIPVIVCSADIGTLRADGPALLDRGCLLLEKPFDLNELLRSIDAAIVGQSSSPTNESDKFSRADYA